MSIVGERLPISATARALVHFSEKQNDGRCTYLRVKAGMFGAVQFSSCDVNEPLGPL